MDPYTAGTERPAFDAEALRSRIPGWGADSDPADRPSVPRERFDPAATGAHWDVPVPQRGNGERERSIEHTQLPPVYGTALPLRGLSGAIRRSAYARYSEARAAHWLLLMAGDRVEAASVRLRRITGALAPMMRGRRSQAPHGERGGEGAAHPGHGERMRQGVPREQPGT